MKYIIIAALFLSSCSTSGNFDKIDLPVGTQFEIIIDDPINSYIFQDADYIVGVRRTDTSFILTALHSGDVSVSITDTNAVILQQYKFIVK